MAITLRLVKGSALTHSELDTNFTDLVAVDATKAPLASPALTGTPTAPTAAPGTNTTQVATTAFAAAIAALKADLASPTFTGVPSGPTAAPGTNTTQFATTAFAAAIAALKADLASPALTGTPTAPTAAPGTNTTQISTTAFVNAAVAALQANIGRRGTVRAATTANITIATALNAGDAIDGVTLAAGNLVLVKNQTAPAENGVYEVGASPARATEFDTYDDHPGALFIVQEGTTNADSMWFCSSNVGGTLGSTAISFSQFSAAGALLAANNLSDLANAATARTNLGLTALATTTPAANIATFLATPTSANLRAAMTDEDGDGSLMFGYAPVTLNGATNLVRSTHGNRLVILNAGSPFTVTIEDDTTGGWSGSDGMTFVNIGAGTVTIAGDGTSVPTAVPGYALTIPQNGVGGAQRTGTNAWSAYGQLAVQAQATWEAGVGTTETVISPAKFAAAVAALAPAGSSLPIQQEWKFFISDGGTSWGGYPSASMAVIQGTVAGVSTPFDTNYCTPRGRMTASDAVVDSGVATGRGTATSGGYMPGSVDSQRVIWEGLWAPVDASAGRRWAAGLYRNNVGNPSASADPHTWTNGAAFIKRAADSNVHFVTNDGSGSGTPIDLGANFPAAHATDALYFGRIVARGGTTPAIDYYLINLKTGLEASGTVTTDIPAAGSLMTTIMWTANGPTTATAATFEASYQHLKLQYQGVQA